MQEPAFVIDVETTKAKARSNELLWVGLGAPGRNYLIPCGHPKGIQLAAERKVKTEACVLYPYDERGLTKTGKPSYRMVEHTLPATFAPPPKQLYPNEVASVIYPLLFSDRAKVGHNVKFDIMSLAKYFGHMLPAGPYHDTIILRHCLREDFDSYSLKDLTGNWFGVPWKERPKWYPNLGEKGVENFGLDVVARYLAKDLRYCWLMYQAFYPLLERRGVQSVYDFEMSVYPVIMSMEYEGFPVDLGALGKVRDELQDRLSDVEQSVHLLVGDQFPLSNTDAKRWVLFGEGKPVFGDSKRLLKTQGLRAVERTKETKVPQVTKEVLQGLSDRGNDVATHLLEWSQLEKLRGTFVGTPGDTTAGLEPTGVYKYLRYPGMGRLPTIHTSFKQHGTVTGRLSASEPNLQQLPREIKGRHSIRELFVADDGYVLIVADYDQIELRCAAFASQDPEMVRVFIEGQDIHSLAAATMMQIPLEQVTKALRQVGKTQNFGTLYGAGAPKIAQVAGVSVKRAEGFIRNYFDTFQGLEDWKRSVIKEAKRVGDKGDPLTRPPYVAIPPNGRRRRLPDLYHVDDWKVWRAERQAVNAYVQGFAANITKLAMIKLYDALEPYDARMIAQVHDEIVVRAHKSCVDEVKGLVSTVMTSVLVNDQPILGEVPLLATSEVGYTWAEAKG